MDLCMYSLLAFPDQNFFLAPNFSFTFWGLVCIKANFARKDWSKEGTQYLSCFHLLYNQVHYLLQQWVHIFPSSFCHPETLPVVFDITGPSEFQMGSGFPNIIPVSILLPGYTSMYLPSLCFLFVFEFGQEPLVHQMSFGIFAWISAHWDRPLLSLEEVIAEYQLGILDPSSLYGPMC